MPYSRTVSMMAMKSLTLSFDNRMIFSIFDYSISAQGPDGAGKENHYSSFDMKIKVPLSDLQC